MKKDELNLINWKFPNLRTMKIMQGYLIHTSKLKKKIWKIYQWPYFWNSHSLLSRGQTCLVFNHLEMQWKWKACCKKNILIHVIDMIFLKFALFLYISKLTLHTPQATVHSSDVADAWFAWHSIQRSIIWFLQIAQLSTTISKKKKKKK